MNQNIVAIIWDFDKTLVDGYMQKPIFEEYGINESDFWKEVNSLPGIYEKQRIKVNKDTIYLNHFITCVNQGIFKGLNNNKLREFGQKLNFYPGIPDIFIKLSKIIEDNEHFQEFNIQLEHYIVSTGLTEVIKGSVINEHIKSIWGCEFIEAPIKSSLHIKEYKSECKETENIISQIAFSIDNTSKTRAIFEINKGANIYPEIDVNSKMKFEDRRVPIEQMIYVADGPSDVPAFSVIKKNGGKTFAIYPKGDKKAFKQVNKLISDSRIDMFAEADYNEGTTTYMWLAEQVASIAEMIYGKNKEAISRSVSKAPSHITD
ncbi:MAG: hypothetical protein K0R15_2043 [Clostridiales bacterium]|jgi:hypothetical protein|nr:hypothetical protein [Clostridiales bacterium]